MNLLRKIALCWLIGISESLALVLVEKNHSDYVIVIADGVYQFSMRSNDGGRLYIGEELVVDNEHLYGEREGCGFIALKAGFYPITVTFFQQLGRRLLDIGWQGPGIPWQIIPVAVLWHEE